MMVLEMHTIQTFQQNTAWQAIGWEKNTFGTAAWKTKSVYTLDDKLVKVAWIIVICGFSGCFEKLDAILKELLSCAVIDG